MANKPTKADYEGFKKAIANPMTPQPIKDKLQSVIDKYASEYEGMDEGSTEAKPLKAPRKPRATKSTPAKRGRKPSSTTSTMSKADAYEKAKADLKSKTGKTEEECETIINQYRELRAKAQTRKAKEEEASKENKKRLENLEEKGDLIAGTKEKTADAVIETTTKDVAEKIVREIEAIEEKAEKEAKAEVAKDKTLTTAKDKKDAIIEKVEQKVSQKTKPMIQRIVIDTSELLTTISNTLGKFDKDSKKEFLIKLRSDIDKLLAKFAFGGMTNGAVQTMNIQQSNLSSSSVNPSQFAKGGGVDDISYDALLDLLKEKLEDSVDDLPRHFENSYDFKGEEVEHQSRDGFIAYTDGGYSVTWFESLSMFWGAGYGLPTQALDNEKDRQIDYSLDLAKDYFKDEYPEIVEELGEDNLDYNSLSEAGYEDEAEELSNAEQENMDGTIMCEIGAYYYSPENDRGIDGKHTLRLFGLVNLESPYHRSGNLEDRYDIDITFDSIEELEQKIDEGLEAIIRWFDGDFYNDSTEKLRIVRMAKGGLTEHGLKVGDKIEKKLDSEGSVIRVKNKKENAFVQLDSGFRMPIYEFSSMAKGGGVRSNSNQVREKVRQHILENVYDYDENEFDNFNDASQHLTSEFKRVADYPNNKSRFPNNQKRFRDYLQGIPFNFYFYNDDIEDFLNGLGINPQNKKYSSDQMWDLYSYLIWKEVEPTYNGNKMANGGGVHKLSKDDALKMAQEMGVDFNKEFHAQSYGNELAELAKKVGYRKSPSASGSIGREFFYHLQKIYDKNKMSKNGDVASMLRNRRGK